MKGKLLPIRDILLMNIKKRENTLNVQIEKKALSGINDWKIKKTNEVIQLKLK